MPADLAVPGPDLDTSPVVDSLPTGPSAAGTAFPFLPWQGEEHTDLAVLGVSGGSGVLPLHAGRTDTLLQESGVIDDQNRIPVAEVLDDVVPHIIEDLIGVPLDPVQQPMDTVRSRVTYLFGQCPAALPLQRSDQTLHVGKRRLPRLSPVDPMHEPPVQSLQLTRPQTDISKVPTHNHTNEPPGQGPGIDRCSTRRRRAPHIPLFNP